MPAFRFRKLLPYFAGGLGVALVVWSAATCSSNDVTSACPMPAPGSKEAGALDEARSRARFPVLYPCELPAGQRLSSTSVIGNPGRQQAELVFAGPFDLTIRQSQFPPVVAPDPAGASHIVVDLSPNVRGTLIERNDGTRRALYHLLWEQDGVHYEVQAYGPPLQRRQVLLVATSLQ